MSYGPSQGPPFSGLIETLESIQEPICQGLSTDSAGVQQGLKFGGVHVVAGDGDDGAGWGALPPAAAGLEPDRGAYTFNSNAVIGMVTEPDVATYPAGAFDDGRQVLGEEVGVYEAVGSEDGGGEAGAVAVAGAALRPAHKAVDAGGAFSQVSGFCAGFYLFGAMFTAVAGPPVGVGNDGVGC